MTVKIQTFLTEQRTVVEEAMERLIPQAEGDFSGHIESMRYSLFVGGKRIRPILCLAAGSAVDSSPALSDSLLPVACALECIHTYSLIHDDLPAMDDDDLRRGKPTNHTVYGEAGAILAGDSLLSVAFDLLSDRQNRGLSNDKRIAIIGVISRAIGPLGMVGGQYLDIISENTDFPFETLRTIHKYKTGALITGSIKAGAIGAGGTPEQLSALESYGDNLGLAFQIVDDLLNATSTAEILGKAAGSDAERGKATYPAYFGIDETRNKARQAVDRSLDALEMFDAAADPLRALADYVYTRSH